MPHPHPNAFGFLNAARRDGLLLSRRNLLKAGLAGFGGLTLPALLQARESNRASPKSVILLWMAGGPSQIDTLDPKPNRPPENRGPFGVTKTKLPGCRCTISSATTPARSPAGECSSYPPTCPPTAWATGSNS